MNERLEARVYGRVQLVMYRDFATRKARALGLVGAVKNLADGTVQVIVEGPRAQLEKYLAKLKKGSVLSHVERVESVWGSATGAFSNFEIVYK